MTTQSNENHEQVNSLSEEHSIQTKTVINALKQQRDQANNALVVLSGEKAVIEHRLAKLTATYNETFQALDVTTSECTTAQDQNRLLRMANANLDSQIKGMKDAIEMFYRDVANTRDIESLRARLGIGEDEEASDETQEDKPQTLWQRFVSAFKRDLQI